MDADVIIVGAGPSGSTAAKNLASRGISVLIIEKLPFPRDIACGGAIFHQCVEDFPYIEPIIDSYNSAIEVISLRSQDRFDLTSGTPIFATITSRAQFDTFLVDQATQAGCSIIYGETVENVKSDHKQIVVVTDKKKYTAKIVIGADSINSIVGRRFMIGLKPRPSEFGLAITQNFVLSEKICNELYGAARQITFFLNFQNMKGLAKIIPQKTTVRVELTVPFSRYSTIREDFTHFVQYAQDAGKIPLIEASINPELGVFPIRTANKRTYGPRCLLVGNAGGFCSSALGMGIYHGMFSGKLAAQAVHKMLKSPLYSYGVVPPFYRLWQRKIGTSLKLHQRIRNFFLFHPDRSSNFIRWVTKHPPLQDIALSVLSGNPSVKLTPTKLSWHYYRYLRREKP